MEDIYLVVYLYLDLHCVQNWISDGQCDDINNHNMDNCSYDGGDCCGSNVVNKYCFNCSCLSNTNKSLLTQNNGILLQYMPKQQDVFGCLGEILGFPGLREAANLEI